MVQFDSQRMKVAAVVTFYMAAALIVSLFNKHHESLAKYTFHLDGLRVSSKLCL